MNLFSSDFKSVEDGYISFDKVEEQFDVIYEAYAQYNIFLNLAGIDRTVNASWSNSSAHSTTEGEMRTALHRGGYTDLNFYTVKSFLYDDFGKILTIKGYCTAPEVLIDYNTIAIDGCSLDFNTLPGSTKYAGRDLGVSGIHEAGHWFGLEHTFARGCVGNGDGIADTPNQNTSTVGCPVGRDSCPDQPGLDPIENYMDYPYDSCRNEFTPGQVTRMFTLSEILCNSL